MTPTDKLLRIPIRFLDGQWECEYGGLVPVKNDTAAELLIAERLISDKSFLERMRAKSNIKVLEQGTKLLAYLATKDTQFTDEQKKHLIPFQKMSSNIAIEYIDNWNSGALSLVEVSIGDPTEQHLKKFDTTGGGLWLLIEGRKTVGLQSSRIVLPQVVSKEPVISLNHAFTKLSETYEPWRISHTGNVYQRFLYKENNQRWYPLELLRNAALAKKEQDIAYQLWQDFIKKMANRVDEQ
jgi:hypothetical protein